MQQHSICAIGRRLEPYTWYNEPTRWSSNSSTIMVHTDGKTDFWRQTYYGFERDSGHFYYRSIDAQQSFTATVNVRGDYKVIYDQAGLMLRNDVYNWIKCGIEYVDGLHYASVVVTVNGWSDWSVVPLETPPNPLRLRVKREKEVVHIDYGEGENGAFKMMRLAYLPVAKKTAPIMVGIMCASPSEESDGFDVTFDRLNITTHS
ncbi:unnamed protein product [Rotaria sp. Silwood1]|nr:unnamed protein product [Rotaria sp. Silwood1]CAF1622224.1 unnamed protein product [Rotaria sp. Silwood1]CAF3703995.1 unnamed protein product [Rotaria sp. Silwood1]CAF3777205.1 unnamed protein product [Rotaria sp. Silwood1]CAF4559021.1 unnamed protein product [Rotaria sp. Silwood1]